MKSEPEIIKELREAEKFGRFQSKGQGAYDELETTEESSEDVPSETTGFFEGDVEPKARVDDTEGGDAENKLQELLDRYKLIFDNVSDVIIYVNKHGKIVNVNRRSYDIFGYKPEEIIGKNFSRLGWFGIKDLPKLIKLFKDALGDKTIDLMELEVKHKDGHIIHVEVGTRPVKKNGKTSGFLSIVRDITEQKKAKDALKESEEKFRTFVDTASDLMNITDKDGTFIDVNEAMARALGYSKEELIGMRIPQILTKESLENDFKPNWEKFVTEGKIDFETTFATKEGKEIYGELKAVAIYDSDGKFAGSRAVFHDLTKRKKAEDEIKYLKEYNENILESNPNSIIVIKGYQIEYVNNSFVSTFGKTRNDYISKELKEAMPVEALSVFKELLQDCDKIKELDIEGKSFVVSSFVVKKAEEEEEEERRGLILQDITERKQMEEKFRVLFESSRDAIMMLAPPTWKFTSGNPSTVEMFKAKNEEEFTSLGPWGLSPEYQPDGQLSSEKAKKMIEKAMKTGSNFFEWVHKRLNGEEFPVTVLLTKMKLEGKELLQATVRDITERKKAEEELRTLNEGLEQKVMERTAEIEKLLKQKDEFVNQLGHDLKTPITPLVTLLPIIQKRQTDQKSKELLNVSIKNVQYMQDLVIKMVQLARINAPSTQLDIEDTNLLEELNKVIDNNQFLFKENKIIVENKTKEDVIIKADKLRLDELLNNLITNAVKYTSENGILTIDAQKDRDFVTISFRDTGIGLNQEQIEHIFDEFYKVDPSRHDLEASGLGLPICKRIVEKHGGKIWVESPGVGKGSTFYFTLKKSGSKKE